MNTELQIFTKQFIQERFMAVVACVSGGMPRSFTCWYVIHNNMMYWKSRTGSEHSRAFVQNSEAGLCIYDHGASYPDDKTGVQVLGTVRQVTDRHEMQLVLDAFADRFGERVLQKNNLDELCAPDTQSTFYACKLKQFKLVAKHLNIHMEEYEDFV